MNSYTNNSNNKKHDDFVERITNKDLKPCLLLIINLLIINLLNLNLPKTKNMVIDK